MRRRSATPARKWASDATRKIQGEGTVREWPDELFMSDEIQALDTRRGGKYGLT